MASTNGQGDVVLQVDFDTSGAEKSAGGLNAAAARLAKTIADAFGVSQKGVDGFNSKIAKATEAVKKQEAEIENLQRKYDTLLSGDVKASSTKSMELELQRTQKEISKTEAAWESLNAEMLKLQNIAGIQKSARGIVSPEMRTAMAGLEKQLDDTGFKWADLEAKAARLSDSLNTVRMNPAASDEAQKLSGQITLANEKLTRLKSEATQASDAVGRGDAPGRMARIAEGAARAGKSVQNMNNEARSGESAFDRMGSGIERAVNRIKRLVIAVFVFDVVRRGLRALFQYMGSLLKTNQQFVRSLQQIQYNLKVAFTPIYQVILPALNSLMSALAKATAYIASFISAIFGKSLSATQEATKSLQESADAIGSTGSASKKSNKELQKYLASFDDLQTIGSKQTDEDSSGGGGGGLGDLAEIGNADTSWIERFQNAIAPTILAFQQLWQVMEPFRDFVAQGAHDFYENFLKPVGLWVLGEGLPRLAYILGIFFDGVDWPRLNQSLAALFTELSKATTFTFDALLDFLQFFLIPMGVWTMNEAFPRFVDSITNLFASVDWETLNAALERMWQALQPFAENIGEGLLWFWENVLVKLIGWTLINFIPAAIDLITAAISALDALITAAKPTFEWLWDNVLKPFAEWTGQAIIDGVQWLTEKFEGLSTWAKNNQSTMDLITGTILAFFAELWVYHTSKKVVSFITSLSVPLSTLATKLFTVYLPVIALTAGIVALAQNWDKLSPAQRTITLLGSLAAAATAAALAVAVFHTSWSVGIAAAAIVGGLALLAGATLFSGQGIGSLPSYTGDTSNGGIRMPSSAARFASYNFNDSILPHLASGAVVPPNREFLAVLGDNKKENEIVAPESTIRSIVREELDALASSGAFGNSGTITIPMHIDGRVFASIIYDLQNGESGRRGVQLVPQI